jgi:hypothetical protein
MGGGRAPLVSLNTCEARKFRISILNSAAKPAMGQLFRQFRGDLEMQVLCDFKLVDFTRTRSKRRPANFSLDFVLCCNSFVQVILNGFLFSVSISDRFKLLGFLYFEDLLRVDGIRLIHSIHQL